MTSPRIGVMGAGAVGCWVGGRLLAEGADVVLVGRAATKEAVLRSGLSLTEIDGVTTTLDRARVRFETEASALGDRDIVLVAVKSAATRETAERLGAVLRPDAIVVSLQNGMRAAEELRRCSERATLAGIVGFNVVARGDGAFRRATSGPLVIEASRDGRLEALRGMLDAAGFDVTLAADIRARQWGKLVVNLNNAVSALSDAPTKEIIHSAGYRRILASLMEEAVGVLRVAGIRPASLTGLPVALLPRLLRLPSPIVRVVARSQLRIDPEARSSMWEDLRRGRATEVDDLNGEIVRLAERCGVGAPLNRRIVELVHEAERAASGSPRLDAEELRRRLTA